MDRTPKRPATSTYSSNSPKWSFTGENEQAGFWREDWTEKPAAQVWRKLVLEKWWTDLSGKTDEADSSFSGRGYLGTYKVTVEHNGKSVSKRWNLKQGDGHLEIRLAP